MPRALAKTAGLTCAAASGLSFSRRISQAWSHGASRILREWKMGFELTHLLFYHNALPKQDTRLTLIWEIEGKDFISQWERLQSHIAEGIDTGKSEEWWSFFNQCISGSRCDRKKNFCGNFKLCRPLHAVRAGIELEFLKTLLFMQLFILPMRFFPLFLW